MHYTQHLLINTQRYIKNYIDASILNLQYMHIEPLCIVIHQCCPISIHTYEHIKYHIAGKFDGKKVWQIW